jgi:hypothetical protein
MKLVLSVVAFAILMGLRDSVEGVVPRMLVAAAAGVALSFAISDVRSRRADVRNPKEPDSQTPGTPGGPRAAVMVVGLIYVISWFIPVLRDEKRFAGEYLFPGWQAFSIAIYPLFSSKPFDGSALEWILSVVSALSNFLFIAAMIRLLVPPGARTSRWSWALAAAAGVNAFWMIDPWAPSGLFAGYYLWLASFVLLAFLARVRTTREVLRVSQAPA